MNRGNAWIVSGLVFCAAARAQHVDVMPVSVIGQPGVIETGSFDFGTFSVAQLPPQRGYENDLDEPAPGADLLVGEAGFTSPGATAAAGLFAPGTFANLPGGVALRFDFRAFNACNDPRRTNLWYWDGLDDDNDGDFADDVDFAPALGTTLTFERDGGLLSAAVDGGALDVPGFVIDLTELDDPGTPDDETGFLHRDLDALLDDADANPGTPIPLGIYAIALDVSYPGAASAQFYWVFNAGLGAAGEGAAEAALECIPEPSSGLVVALAAGWVVVRRRGR